MLIYTIEPLVGVGPIRFGMSRGQVRLAMPDEPKPFRKSRQSKHETDAFHESAFQVFYSGEYPAVEFIELSDCSLFRVFYEGVDVFETPADHLVEFISRSSPFDATHGEIPYTYIFPGFELSLWRPDIPRSGSDEEGRFFSTIGIGVRGYRSGS